MVLGRTPDETATYTSPKFGALLDATPVDAAALVIPIVALRKRLVDVVRASIAQSIFGHTMVVLGLSLHCSGPRNGIQSSNAKAAGTNATMLMLAVAAPAIPAVLNLVGGEMRPSEQDIVFLSDGLAVFLIVLYVPYLILSLRQKSPEEKVQGHETYRVTRRLPIALGILTLATIAIVVMREILVGSLESTAKSWGLSRLFVGIMQGPLVGDVAKHLMAV